MTLETIKSQETDSKACVTNLVIQRGREGHLYTYEEKCAFCWLLVRKVLRKHIGMSLDIVICAIYSVVEQSKETYYLV